MNVPRVIGFELEKAKKLIGSKVEIIVEETSTIFTDKIMERQGNSPIVVRQIIRDGKIVLTTSLFK
ncbi:MAG: hypothetical protein ACOZCL_04865 [Bacillota bacterium]